MPSHALPPGADARARRDRRRESRRKGRRRLSDWRTWGGLLAVVAVVQLSGTIAGRLWPTAHGAGYVATRVVVGGVLGAAIGGVLVGVVILAGTVRDRWLQP